MSIYNNDRKQKYIDYMVANSQNKDLETLKRSMINFFYKVGTVEQDFESDISDADYETTLNMISLLSTGSNRYINLIIDRLRVYINWCIKENLTINSENHLDGVRAEEIDKSFIYRNTMVKDEQQLIDYLDVVFESITEETLDIIYRTYVLLLFAGVTAKHTEELLLTAYNPTKSTLMSNGEEIQLSPATVNHLTALIETTRFNVKGGKTGSAIRRKVITGHLIETALPNRDNITHYFKSALSKAVQRYTNIKKSKKLLTTSTIFKSGVFYRAYIRECETSEICLSEMWKDQPEPSNKMQVFKRVQFNKLLINEYENWKKAFMLTV